MIFSAAFPCMRSEGCPQSKNVRPSHYCPCWYEGTSDGQQLLETNRLTGEQRRVSGCFFEIMPRLLQYTVQEQGQTSAEISAMRERTAAVVADKVGAVISQGFTELISRVSEQEKLEHDG